MVTEKKKRLASAVDKTMSISYKRRSSIDMTRGILNKVGYSYNDLKIIPAVTSDISSRKECNIFEEDGMLPIFASPMLSVTNEHNFEMWKNNKVRPIAPRSIAYKKRLEYLQNGDWVALSLKEFDKLFITGTPTFKVYSEKTYNVCVDLANGHMHSLYKKIWDAKHKSYECGYNLVVMTGNIANPETYKWLCDWQYESNVKVVDYIRLSIGTGAGCLTTSNTGVHYPIGSLINECKEIKDNYDATKCPAIVADGGIRNYDDINKALALGSDYVMIGSLLSGLLESSAEMVIESNDPVKFPVYYDREAGEISYNVGYDETKTIRIWDVNHEEEKREFIRSMKNITKKFIGMSTKEAQIAINAALEEPIIADKKDLKTSEGCTKFIPVHYTLAQWLENLQDYLRSAMSYCDAKTLDEFRNNTYLIPCSPGTMIAVNK
jgi:IMP dehydrogenase/GMP reductase